MEDSIGLDLLNNPPQEPHLDLSGKSLTHLEYLATDYLSRLPEPLLSLNEWIAGPILPGGFW